VQEPVCGACRVAVVNQVQERHRAKGARALSRPYRKIIAEYHRQYPHQARLQNTGDWRFDHCSRTHYHVMAGNLVWWYEDGASVSASRR
jgi:hypothetical protein